MKHIVIIGGGAAGLLAANYAKQEHTKVTILEKNHICGKKILATGNGKCNYWNEEQTLKHYHSTHKELIKEILTEDNKTEIMSFFTRLGIYPKIKNGYYYPSSNQATTIKDALTKEVLRKNINIKNNTIVEKIEKVNNDFKIYTSNEIIKADKVIIATGSKAAPKTGSDGFGYKLLKKFNHQVIEPLPALVQLKTTGKYLKNWAGIRTDVEVSLYENDNLIRTETGEIQLTDYGISGICIFNLSRYVSIGLSKNKKEQVKINFLPFLSNPKVDLTSFISNQPKRSIKTQLEGFLNSKLVDVILTETNIKETKSYNELTEQEKDKLISFLTAFKTDVIGTNSFEQAQVCTGGIPLTEVNLKTMESKLVKNLYIVGELLDVDGDCGGYNLSFAWISGMLAGIGSAKND